MSVPQGNMTLRAQAYDAFTRHLLTRRLLPGQFVTQRDLAALVGFPLGAVREMIPRLEAEGLVRTLAQRGLQIVGSDPRLIRDAFNLREIIESEALVQFTRSAGDATIQRHLEAHAQVEHAARIGPVDAALVERAQAVDWGLHDAMVEHMNNALINDVHRVNAIRIRIIMYDRVTLSPDSLGPALREHRPILHALQQRNPAAGLVALKAHLASARRRALSLDDVAVAA